MFKKTVICPRSSSVRLAFASLPGRPGGGWTSEEQFGRAYSVKEEGEVWFVFESGDLRWVA